MCTRTGADSEQCVHMEHVWRAMGTGLHLPTMLCMKLGHKCMEAGTLMPKVELGIAFQKCCVEELKLGVSWFLQTRSFGNFLVVSG